MIMPATWRFSTASMDRCSYGGSQPTLVRMSDIRPGLALSVVMLAKKGSPTPGTATLIAASPKPGR